MARAFWDFVEKSDGCWTWAGGHNNRGYSYYFGRGAHRIAYEELRGPIPAGLTIDHLCRNKGCVNPEHLEVVTRSENTRRGHRWDNRTHCLHGHEQTAENTGYSTKRGYTYRFCLPCRRATDLRHYYAKRRVAA